MIRKSLLLAIVSLVLIASSLFASWDEGVEAFRSGKFAAAEKSFRAVVDNQPEASQGHYMLGLSLLKQKKAAKAVGPLQRAVELAPEQLSYRLVMAQAQLESGNAGKAVKSLAQIDPSQVGNAQQMTWIQLLEKSTRKQPGADSAALLEKAVADIPDQRRLWIALARVAPKPERAFEAAAKAWELDKKNSEIARWAVSKALHLAGNASDDKSLGWYKKAAEIAGPWVAASPSAQSHLLFGQSLMGSRDYEAARKQLAAATDAGGGAEAWYELGRCSLALKRADESLRELDTALEKKSETDISGRIHASRGAALRQLERFEEAGKAYGKAGLDRKVDEMSKLAEMKAENDEFSEELAACERDLQELEDIEEENKALKGTAAWKEIERQRDMVMRRCRSYFEAEEPGEG